MQIIKITKKINKNQLIIINNLWLKNMEDKYIKILLQLITIIKILKCKILLKAIKIIITTTIILIIMMMPVAQMHSRVYCTKVLKKTVARMMIYCRIYLNNQINYSLINHNNLIKIKLPILISNLSNNSKNHNKRKERKMISKKRMKTQKKKEKKRRKNNNNSNNYQKKKKIKKKKKSKN